MKIIPPKKLDDRVVSKYSVNFSQNEKEVVERKFEQIRLLADKFNGIKSEKSFLEIPKKRGYKMAAAIFAVFVLQFVWQFSFIQSEKLLNVEKTLTGIQLEELPSNIITEEKSVATETVYVEKNAEKVSPVKNVIPIVYRQPENKSIKPENKPIQVEIKKKTLREPKDESRLRRAEQLLTGF